VPATLLGLRHSRLPKRLGKLTPQNLTHVAATNFASGYPTAFKAILICYGLVFFVVISLRIYLTLVNRSRDRSEGIASLESPAAGNKQELTAEDYEDVTDLKTPGFRYRM
jgi:hypothetical protein